VSSSTWSQKVGSWFRQLFKIMAYGLCLGIAINIPFIAIDLYHHHHFSRADVFDKLQAGLPTDQAKKILDSAKISCVPTEDSGSKCYFADFWREYYVHLDFVHHHVAYAGYHFRPRYFIAVRLGLKRKPQYFD
jgi:hypothetical protein